MQSMPVSINSLRTYKAQGEKFSCLTAYDASFARILDHSGIDVVLVGDSLGMVVQGHASTIPVTMDQIVYHTKAVVRGCARAMIMADLPFASYTLIEDGVRNAARLMQEGGAHIVKLEGTANQVDVVKRLADNGIPVCAHVGLRPQFVHKLGGYKVQGRDRKVADELIKDAVALERAGADLVLLECVPAQVTAEVMQAVHVPVIGIGAGAQCDGQVLVLYDVIGISSGKRAKFAKDFLGASGSIADAITRYILAVKSGAFPAVEHTYT